MALTEERIELDAAMRAARLSEPIVWVGNNVTFAGLGDSASASQLTSAIRGATATAIRTIKQRVGSLELGVYIRRFVNMNWEDSPAFDHPLQTLLDNPTLGPQGQITHTSRQFWSTAIAQLLSVGETYYTIIHDSGMPVELQLAKPGGMEPLISGGRVVGYRVLGASGSPLREIGIEDAVRVWEPDPFHLYTSRGVMGNNAALISMDQTAAQSWDQFYRNDATPKLAFVSTDSSQRLPTQDEEEQVYRSWRQRLHRIFGSRQGVPAFVKPGWGIEKLSSQDEAASGVTLMQHARRKVFEAFGVPPSIVGDVVDVNRAAAETSRYAFDVNTIEPLAGLNAEALTVYLASQYETLNDNVKLIVKYKPFIARDKFFDIQQQDMWLRNKVVTVDEVRGMQEPAMDPSSWGELPVGTIGEVPYTGEEPDVDLSGFDLEEPEATPPADVDEEAPGEEGEEERTRARASVAHLRAHFLPAAEWERQVRREKQYQPAFRSMQRSVFQRQAEITLERWLSMERRRGENQRQGDADDLVEELFPMIGWQALFQATTETVRAESYLRSATETTEAITGRRFQMTEEARRILSSLDLTHYLFVNATTQRNLKDALVPALSDVGGASTEKVARSIAEVFGVRKSDATRIARTEIATSVQSAQIQGYAQTGVVERKMWNTSLDGAVRDSHIIEGQTRGLDEAFTLADGGQAMAPADPTLDAGDRVNCRCFVTPVFIDETPLSVIAQ